MRLKVPLRCDKQIFNAALCLAALSLLASSLACAQTTCDDVSLPVSVILPDGRFVRGLKSDSFIAEAKRRNVSIESVDIDSGPRRILFVVDGGQDLPLDARKAQAGVVVHIVANAAPADSFGLITARGSVREVPFGEGRSALMAAVNEFGGELKPRRSDEGVLDAMMDGMKWFQEPRPGDAIILMASGIEKNQRASFSEVEIGLSKGNIRLFGFLLGPLVMGADLTWLTTDTRGRLSIQGGFVPNEQNLSNLSWGSGGYMVVENAKMPWKEYRLTDAHLHELAQEGWRIYGSIAEFYRIRAKVSGSDRRETWKLNLSEKIRNRVPQAKVLYPRKIASRCVTEKAD